MSSDSLDARIAAVRAFNRLFPRQLAVLRDGVPHNPWSTAEVHVLEELAIQGEALASTLGRDLGLDQGYLSRILTRFEQEGLVDRVRSSTDGRARVLRLTEAGWGAYAPLDRRMRDAVSSRLASLPEQDQARLVAAMNEIAAVLDQSVGSGASLGSAP